MNQPYVLHVHSGGRRQGEEGFQKSGRKGAPNNERRCGPESEIITQFVAKRT